VSGCDGPSIAELCSVASRVARETGVRNPTIASLLDLVIEDAGERDEECKKNGKLRTSPPDMDRVYLKIYLISERRGTRRVNDGFRTPITG
jgi:hypothetical protein